MFLTVLCHNLFLRLIENVVFCVLDENKTKEGTMSTKTQWRRWHVVKMLAGMFDGVLEWCGLLVDMLIV